MTATQPISVEEFVTFPDEITDHHELVEGELVEVPSSTLRAALIRDDLRVLLQTSPTRTVQAMSELDVQTSTRTVRRPSISVFSLEQIGRFDRESMPAPESPMIAVEVLSPSERMIAVSRKVAEYLNAGSREVWLIDHLNSEIHIRSTSGVRLLRDGDTLETDLLPGLSVPVRQLFNP